MNNWIKLFVAGGSIVGAAIKFIVDNKQKKELQNKNTDLAKENDDLKSENTELKAKNDELIEKYKPSEAEKEHNEKLNQSIEQDPFDISDEELLGND